MNIPHDELQSIFKKHPAIKLAYLFGSQARGEAGPLSDYDFAFFLDESDAAKRFDLKLELIASLAKLLKTDAVDVSILNDLDAPELKYAIIKEGILLYEVEPFIVLVEPRILNEYFDFHESLKRYGLTKA